MDTQKFFLIAGAALGGLGVAVGAFGAHALRPTLEAAGRLDTFETAVKYQFYHAFALLAVGLLAQRIGSPLLSYSGHAFLAGTLVFSGSLYVLCLTGIRWLGAVTPLGGVLMIAGWGLLAWAVAKANL